jgi:hypothetical protein
MKTRNIIIGILPLILISIATVGVTTVSAAESGKRSLLRDPKTVQLKRGNARHAKNRDADVIFEINDDNEQQRNLNTNEEHEAALTNNSNKEEEEQRSLGVNNGLCLQHSIEDCASQTTTFRGEEVKCCTCTKLVPFEQTVCVIGTAQFTAGWDICSKGCLEKSS